MRAIVPIAAGGGVTLDVHGIVDGSLAWRLVRLARRLARSGRVHINLSASEGLLPFGVAILAEQLESGECTISSLRDEHAWTLRWAGLGSRCECLAPSVGPSHRDRSMQ